MFKAAGAASMTMPSNELYIAMQTGAVDAAVTSSTSMISFKLEGTAKNLTSAGGRSFFFVLEPLLMSKAIFDDLSADEKTAIVAVGAEMERFGLDEAKRDDVAMAEVYAKAGVKVHEMDAAALERWREVARASAWKDYAEKSPSCQRFLALAQSVAA
jgi:TRAP-type transport system periplasmic protein